MNPPHDLLSPASGHASDVPTLPADSPDSADGGPGSAGCQNPVEAALRLAAARFQRGELTVAAELVARVLDVQPDRPEAWQLLADIAWRSGSLDEALELNAESIRHGGTRPEFLVHRAALEAARGRLGEAEQLARMAAQLAGQPGCAGEDVIRGGDGTLGGVDPAPLILQAQSALAAAQLPLAEACFQLALLVCRHSTPAWQGLGICARRQGRWDIAEAAFQNHSRLAPQDWTPLVNLGNVYRDQGALDQAVECYQAALAIDREAAPAHHNLGLAREHQDRLDAAVDCYRQALAVDPNYSASYNNLGLIAARQDHPRDALGWFQRGLDVDPNSVELNNNLAKTLRDLQRLDASRQAYRRASELPGAHPLLAFRAATVFPAVFASRLELDACLGQLEHAIATRANGAGSQLPAGNVVELLQYGSEPPFELQFLDGNLKELKQRYAALFGGVSPGSVSQRLPSGRPRIGLVVTDRHEGIFLRSMRGILQRLSPDQFELIVFCSRSAVGRVGEALPRGSVRPLPASPATAVQCLREAGCDVLYYWEIGSDSWNYFLPFARLAPVQCTSWGLQVTSGIATVDFYLSSRCVEPPDAQTHYSERLLLADRLLTFQHRPELPAGEPDRGRYGLPEGGHLFGCLQNLGKFHPDFDHWLLELLDRDPEAWLLVAADHRQVAVERLRTRWREALGPCFQRVRFFPRLDRQAYLEVTRLCDALLDPPVFGGVNTTYDGLGLGVPIVTCPSGFQRGRYAAGCYRQMELEQLIAPDRQQYIARALSWGGDRDARQHATELIRDRHELLFEVEAAVTAQADLLDQLAAAAQH